MSGIEVSLVDVSKIVCGEVGGCVSVVVTGARTQFSVCSIRLCVCVCVCVLPVPNLTYQNRVRLCVCVCVG